jgi:hypothetical protein
MRACTFFLIFVYIWKLNNTQTVSYLLYISRHNIDRIEYVLKEKLIENLHLTHLFLFALSMYNVPRKYFTLPFIHKKAPRKYSPFPDIYKKKKSSAENTFPFIQIIIILILQGSVLIIL